MTATTAARSALRRAVPFGVRLEILRLRRLPQWIAERHKVARRSTDDSCQYSWLLATHNSPLERTPGAVPRGLQDGKETNVRLAAALLDGLVIAPGQTFSYHHALGRPTRRRGFREGLELRNGSPTGNIGGGLCQVSNSFYWVAVQAGMRITERHRHGLDLFPDHERTVPFGCGATVVYNYADFRFENPLDQPVVLRARVEDGSFISEIRTKVDPGIVVEVEETEHRFIESPDGWIRENRITRRFTDGSGTLMREEEVAHNIGRVLYEPSAISLQQSAGPRAQ